MLSSPSFKSILKTLAFSIPAGVTIVDVVGYVAKVEGFSMQPVLNPDPQNTTDYVFLHNWPVATNAYDRISRGDIVALISPRDPEQRIIKRVIGLAGDVVETRGYKKPYVRVPVGHCWVEGDHHVNSLDSNIFGPVALGLIRSKAKCIVWPPSRWQLLTSNPSYVAEALKQPVEPL